MKIIQMRKLGGPEVLELVDVEEPTVGTSEVMVKLYYAGVNPADTYIREGGYAFFSPTMPYTPGFDGAGVIEQVGKDVSNFKKGDRVFVATTLSKRTTGTYAEKMVCDAESVRKLPSFLSFAQGAAIGVPATAAYRALFQRGRLKAGEKVLIHGASGGVGSLVVQMAKHIGAYVIGTAGSDEGLKKVKKWGADIVINHHDKDYLEKIPSVDLVIEMLANINLEKDLKVLNKFGRVVIVGNRGSLDFNPRLIMNKEVDILGMAIWNALPNEYMESLDNIEKMLENKVIDPEIGSVYPLEKANQAQYEIINKTSQGKMLLKIHEE